ncbi:PH domain-containing protein [Roseomonas nepalensis]|uniref:PH domain-containing protein n=1 Tax=Muricoccus nepalensis TaxID=1854500 RepID=A0A502G9U6_9PROT|nr:photosynthetic complex putative assembly protein PuhB [Roseomonas nepalensis]TPG58544.1 PH domain-containing protein [Roseomonas nepalensis]
MRPAAIRPDVREHEGEPIPGLPEALPTGEVILWQGAPEWRLLARRAFHLRGIAAYFAALAVFRAGAMISEGADGLSVAGGVAMTLLLGAVPLAILAAVAVLSARSTLYTLTDRRLVMRVGIALPMTLNVPFGVVASAAARIQPDGMGDVVLAVLPPHRMSWVALWPHARPWCFARPEPMLRSLPDARTVAGLLSRALAAHASQPVPSLAAAGAAQAGPAGPAVAAA